MTHASVGMRYTCTLSAMFVLLSGSAYGQNRAIVDRRPFAIGGSAQQLLSRRVTVSFDQTSLRHALDVLSASARIRMIYRASEIDPARSPVSIHAVDEPLGDVLVRILMSARLQAIPLTDNVIMITTIPSGDSVAFSTIAGIVRHAQTRNPLRGVRVKLDDQTRPIETSDDGAYRIPGVPAGPHILTFQLIGFSKRTVNIIVTGDATASVDAFLEPAVTALDQVVVTGMVIPTELKAVPNAISVITAKDIEQRRITSIDQLFRGDIPGLFAQRQGTNTVLDEVVMFSRGATALSAASANTTTSNDGNFLFTNPIKTYVDGVEMADSKYLSQIDPKSIERIEILTGPQASTIYGSNAINGVMQIFTKRGTSDRPQLTLNLLSGWVENNFSNARTPQHDYGAQVNGVERHFSYNAGGSWNYIGPWTPAKRVARLNGAGGARLDLSTMPGHLTADFTIRRTSTQNQQNGNTTQVLTAYRESGWWNPVIRGCSSCGIDRTYALTGQTLGMSVFYTPMTSWSHEFGIGQDAEDVEQRNTARSYSVASDTNLYLQQTYTDRRSFRYTTTVRATIAPRIQATITAGADAWNNLNSSWSVSPQILTGTLGGTTSISRQPSHNTGGFVQTQFDLGSRLFATYGLRAEWNPNYGKDAQPNYAPRYGMSYVQELGGMTMKLRASYGRSTRPPSPNLKVVQTAAEAGFSTSTLDNYGNFDYYFANPRLGPEYQRGGEGGVEMYFGARGSLVVTRYNQTVDGLIANPLVDSVRSLTPCAATFVCSFENSDVYGYGYRYQYQYLNVGSIRNEGWELQGSATAGPFVGRGTYSWTKSRVLGVIPAYRSFFSIANGYPQYQPGATFKWLPEHTWAIGVTYTRAQTAVTLNMIGLGQVVNFANEFFYQNLAPDVRLLQNRQNLTASGRYSSVNSGYVVTDMTITHRVSHAVEGLIQAQNIANQYANDYRGDYATLGRQVKVGVQLHL